MECNMCQKNICLNGKTKINFLNKMTAWCGNSKTDHVKCAIEFNRYIDSCYEFVSETYVSESAMTFYRAQCKLKYLYYGKKSQLKQ